MGLCVPPEPHHHLLSAQQGQHQHSTSVCHQQPPAEQAELLFPVSFCPPALGSAEEDKGSSGRASKQLRSSRPWKVSPGLQPGAEGVSTQLPNCALRRGCRRGLSTEQFLGLCRTAPGDFSVLSCKAVPGDGQELGACPRETAAPVLLVELVQREQTQSSRKASTSQQHPSAMWAQIPAEGFGVSGDPRCSGPKLLCSAGRADLHLPFHS